MQTNGDSIAASGTLKLLRQETYSENVVGIDHIGGNVYTNTINIGNKTIYLHQRTLKFPKETKSIFTSKKGDLTK